MGGGGSPIFNIHAVSSVVRGEKRLLAVTGPFVNMDRPALLFLLNVFMPFRVTAETMELVQEEVPSLNPQLSKKTPEPPELLFAVRLLNVMAPLVRTISPACPLNLNWLLPVRVTAATVDFVQTVPLYPQLSNKAPFPPFELFTRLLAVMAPFVWTSRPKPPFSEKTLVFLRVTPAATVPLCYSGRPHRFDCRWHPRR